MAVGIIAEYNPFHNGHVYHIEQVRRLFPEVPLVLVVSGPFLERGDVSLLNKWDKTKIALQYGVDLVVELPFPFASQSADFFAQGSIEILTALQVTDLVFGSECNDLATLTSLAQAMQSEEFQKQVRDTIKLGYNYPTACGMAFKALTNYELNHPNDVLGVCYLAQIMKQKANIQPHTIARTTGYHEQALTGMISSATSIRQALREGKEITHQVPPETTTAIIPNLSIESYFPFFRYLVFSEGLQINQYQGVNEGIEHLIVKYIHTCQSFSELTRKIKSKRYSETRLYRMYIHILCRFTKQEAEQYQHIHYLRILGFNQIGQKYLHQVKKDLTHPILVNCRRASDPMLALEQRVMTIYSLPLLDGEQLIKKEYLSIPLIF